MSQVPSDYTPDTDFSTLAATPILTLGLPGAQLDAEFEAIADSLNDTIDRLSEIQRDDGQIRNGMVKLPTLASDVLALLVAGSANLRGAWASGESYEEGDVISQPFTGGIRIGGTLNPDPPPSLPYAGIFDGFVSYSTTGTPAAAANAWRLRANTGDDRWELTLADNESADSAVWTATLSGTVVPSDGADWAPFDGDADGTPVFEEFEIANRGTFICIEAHLSGEDFDDDILKWALVAAPSTIGQMVVDSFTGDGTDTTFTLSQAPLSENNTQVYVDGVYQVKSGYSVAGTVLTFAVAPANAAVIEVVMGVPTEIPSVDIADNSVTTDKLVDGAVTEDKLADGSVTADKLAAGAAVPDDSITAAKLQNNSVTTDKIAAGNVTEGKLASGSVSESKLATGAVTANKLASSAVTTAKLADLNVTAGKLATDAIETEKIKDANVTAAKLAADAVTNLKILAGTIEFDRLNSSSLAAGLLGINGIPKVNVRFAGTSVVGTASNVAAITNTGTGKYRVDFTTALADANYIPQVSIAADRSAATYRTAGIEAAADCTTTNCTISVRRVDTGNLAPFAGSEFVTLTIF